MNRRETALFATPPTFGTTSAAVSLSRHELPANTDSTVVNGIGKRLPLQRSSCWSFPLVLHTLLTGGVLGVRAEILEDFRLRY
jgi:hypothetical protein